MAGRAGHSARLKMLVDVSRSESFGDHHDLQVIDQLRHFLRGFFRGLILGGHPDFGRLLHDLLTDPMYSGIQFSYGSRTFRPG